METRSAPSCTPTRIRVAATLLIIAALAPLAAPAAAADGPPLLSLDEKPQTVSQDFKLLAPNKQYTVDGVLQIRQGFVLQADDRVIMGDALRWDQVTNELFATGNVLITLPARDLQKAGRYQDTIKQIEQISLMVPDAAASLQQAKDALIALEREESNQVGLTPQGVRIEAKHLGLKRLPVDDNGTPIYNGVAAGRFPYLGEAFDVLVYVALPAPDLGPTQATRLARLKAKKLRLLPDRLILEDVVSDAGHGALIEIRAPEFVIGLREEIAEDRRGFERQVADVTVWQPQVRVIGAPVLWLPVLYRDFTINYPWTRYEFGNSNRLGNYVHFFAGNDLPSITTSKAQIPDQVDPLTGKQTFREERVELKTRLEGRVDYHQKAGAGYGAQLDWFHPQGGEGRYLWYGMPKENIFLPRGAERALLEGPATFGRFLGSNWFAGQDAPAIQERSAHVVDIEHQWHQNGWSAYGRYVDIPDADPIAPDVLDPAALYAPPERRAPDERFRADYVPDSLETAPLARRGLAIAWTSPWASVVTDTEWKHHEDLPDTEREIGIQTIVPATQILGPLHIEGDGWWESLRRYQPEQRYANATWERAEADRLTYDTALSANSWIGGIALDGRAGIRGQFYQDGELDTWRREPIPDVLFGPGNFYIDTTQNQALRLDDGGRIRQISHAETDGQSRWVNYFDAGLSFRLEGTYGGEDEESDSFKHIFTPRIGFEYTTDYRGQRDDWIDFSFGDDRETLTADERYITVGFNSSLVKNSQLNLVSLDITSRWAVRAKERTVTPRFSAFESALDNVASQTLRDSITTSLALYQPNWQPAARNAIILETQKYVINPGLNDFDTLIRTATSDSNLVSVTGRLDLNPTSVISVGGNFTYDALRERIDNMNLRASWIPHERVQLSYVGTWLPSIELVDPVAQAINDLLIAQDPLLTIDTVAEVDNWQHVISGRFIGNRYALSTEVTLRPDGPAVDGLNLEITRKIVDGTIGANAEFLWDNFGNGFETSFGVTVNLFGFDLY